MSLSVKKNLNQRRSTGNSTYTQLLNIYYYVYHFTRLINKLGVSYKELHKLDIRISNEASFATSRYLNNLNAILSTVRQSLVVNRIAEIYLIIMLNKLDLECTMFF